MNTQQEIGAAKPEHEKTYEIIINGRKRTVAGEELSFEQIVNLAYNDNPPSGPNVVITVTYSKGEDRKEGTLLPGQTVKIKDGMIFNVTATDKS